MTFTSDEETAMILPIPTVPGTVEDVVQFVSLNEYPDFFRDLELHFSDVWAKSRLLAVGPDVALKVHQVGAFEASFVPGQEFFDRLDNRFRIPQHIWKQLPEYESYGFVVFKLRAGNRLSVHPMAFSFQTRDPGSVFFPTVHIHDTTFQQMAAFDHILYTQNRAARGYAGFGRFWMPNGMPVSQFLKVSYTNGVVDDNAPCYQTAIVGTFPNTDIVIPI
jgi:hypothetical protein